MAHRNVIQDIVSSAQNRTELAQSEISIFIDD